MFNEIKLATGRQPGRFSEKFKSKSRLKIWRSCTPPFDLQSTGDQRGGYTIARFLVVILT